MAERCRAFASELMAEVPEVQALGIVIASRYLNPETLSGFVLGPDGPVLNPVSLLQLSKALTNVGEHLWGNLLPQLLQGLEDVAEERARLINEQAKPLARMGQPAQPPPPARHAPAADEGPAAAVDGQHG